MNEIRNLLYDILVFDTLVDKNKELQDIIRGQEVALMAIRNTCIQILKILDKKESVEISSPPEDIFIDMIARNITFDKAMNYFKITYINTAIADKKTKTEAAKFLGISRSYLSRVTNQLNSGEKITVD